MRVIAGQFRGRRLLPPAGDITRPITDRVKQSLFDILTPLLENARVYDCFAGTGSMGLEALSRGARHVTYFELDPSARALLQRNIETLQVQQRSVVISADLFGWFGNPANAPSPDKKIDLIFFDPPYRFVREREADLRATAKVIASVFLNPGGTIVFRHDAEDVLRLPPFTAADTRTYGSMTIELLEVPAGATDSPAASGE